MQRQMVSDDVMMSVAEVSQESVTRRLEKYDIVKKPELARLFPPGQYPHTRRCAILVPLFFHPSDGQLHVLLTQRSSTLSSHPSHVAFPGGVQEPTDADDTHTALREAHEEIGLPPDDVTVVAHLPPCFVRNNNSVYPVVGFIPSDFTPKPNPHEVSLVFSVPLRTFTSDLVTFSSFDLKGSKMLYPSMTIQVNEDRRPVVVWGFTCSLCVHVARTILGPFKRVNLFVGEAAELSLWRKEVDGGFRDDLDDDDRDDNVFRDWMALYHVVCKATRPNAHL
ncbi:uncharacterized protein [Littorina saxatilis]|uniref:uncharacterized protein isoform X2 n=1 Tax=Littorina saxatilis TaxID=31220 RepID=UPI0038B548F7